MLRDGVVHEGALPPHGIKLDLTCAGDVLRHDHREFLLDDRCGFQEEPQLVFIVDDAHCRAREHIRGSHKHGEVDGARKCQCILKIHELRPLGLVDPQAVAHLRKLGPVLGHVDRPCRCAQQGDAMLCQLRGQIVRRLAAHRDDDSSGSLEPANLQYSLQGQLLKVKPIALVIVRGDCLRVAVDDHGAVAGLSERPHSAHAAPVELD
mmetsp:Transcript_90928/g.257440  ORF Transcript_90928/g.257440 Transcript_90928/m.257440 type:complete len:207 (-) Transcript_90928:451-1071(-)